LVIFAVLKWFVGLVVSIGRHYLFIGRIAFIPSAKMHSIPSHRIPFAGAHSIALGPTFNTHSIPFGRFHLFHFSIPFHFHSIIIPFPFHYRIYLSIYLYSIPFGPSWSASIPSIYLSIPSIGRRTMHSIYFIGCAYLPFHFIYLSNTIGFIYLFGLISIYLPFHRSPILFAWPIYSFGHLSIGLSIPFHFN
jgi:hypothetical protein